MTRREGGDGDAVGRDVVDNGDRAHDVLDYPTQHFRDIHKCAPSRWIARYQS
jgi:hypothetical protein